MDPVICTNLARTLSTARAVLTVAFATNRARLTYRNIFNVPKAIAPYHKFHYIKGNALKIGQNMVVVDMH